jgi:hypothetical protein
MAVPFLNAVSKLPYLPMYSLLSVFRTCNNVSVGTHLYGKIETWKMQMTSILQTKEGPTLKIGFFTLENRDVLLVEVTRLLFWVIQRKPLRSMPKPPKRNSCFGIELKSIRTTRSKGIKASAAKRGGDKLSAKQLAAKIVKEEKKQEAVQARVKALEADPLKKFFITPKIVGNR